MVDEKTSTHMQNRRVDLPGHAQQIFLPERPKTGGGAAVEAAEDVTAAVDDGFNSLILLSMCAKT